ncbi:MAG: DUF4167 domain-containing protein [Proteobacteria bacterium]|nr:DUF4167 domain-containing protein [Pseudomonadota bacterium]
MRHNSQGRRGRHRGNGGHHRHGGSGGGQNRAQVFDSNGPEVRIRGTAYQICEKYQALAKDASSMGDRVLAESYLQHAEHYQRIISQWHDSMPPRSDVHYGQQQGQQQQHSGNDKAEEADLGLPASITGTKQDAKAEGFLEDA